MVSQLNPSTESTVSYPESDGKPMSDNTKQFRWIVVIKENLEALFADDPNVFIAGDLLWYPIEGNNKICTAPDTMVVFGRPKGDRGSYQQWKEGNLPPQVVFEILSPGNTQTEMEKKLLFYDRYGVNEYYIYDPDSNQLRGWLRGEAGLDAIADMADWISPQLQIRFKLLDTNLEIFSPQGERFLTHTEISQRLEQERQRVEQERQRADQAEQARREAIPRLLQLGLTVEQVAEALGLAAEEIEKGQEE